SFPKHYVAIVPADLRSAGIKYKDLLIRLLPILSLHHLYFIKYAVLLADQKLAALTFGSDIIFRQINSIDCRLRSA
ncbi:hypothetical protein, partial [Xylanibacter rarus]|uniref:hypothetical protein n=1 Tax=Xylanibacter rarus TaxID=1676614 RepID=UPI003AB96D1C